VHEFGLCEGIVDAVLTRAAGRPVTRVRVRVGALHRVAEPALEQAFEMIAAGTVAEHAAVDLVVIPVHLTCHSCGWHDEVEEPYAACERCGGTDLTAEGGDELTLESISLAAPAP
jgi:hydrogenase nickel incorporation protein HypA/HybF